MQNTCVQGWLWRLSGCGRRGLALIALLAAMCHGANDGRAAISAASLPDISLFRDYAFFEFGNGQLNLSSFTVHGDIAKSAGTHSDDIDLSSSKVGTIYKDTAATAKLSSTTRNGIVNQDMGPAKSQAISASVAFASLTADQYLGNLNIQNNYTLDLTGQGAHGFVISVGNFSINAKTLTIKTDPGAFVIFNIAGSTVNLNDAKFALVGLNASDLLFNVTGAGGGNNVTLKGNVVGSWLVPQRWVDPDSVTLHGAVWGGKTIDADSGTLYAQGFRPVVPEVPIAPVPEASTVWAGALAVLALGWQSRNRFLAPFSRGKPAQRA